MTTNAEIVRAILNDVFGGFRPAADALGIPSSTVQRWIGSGRIPAWRREAVMTAARKRKVRLDEIQIAYLRDKRREPKLSESLDNGGCSGMNGNQHNLAFAATPYNTEL